MTDRQIHDRIMEILEDKIRSGGVLAGVSAGYGTKKGAKKAICTKRKNGILPPKGRCKPQPKKRVVKKVAKKPTKKSTKVKVGGKRGRWINFVKKYAKDYGLTYREALQEASIPYHEVYGIPYKK